MFVLGDTVVYRHHVCAIVDLREKYFDDKDYFELHTILEKPLKLYVAVSDAVPPAMRPVMNREQALALVDSIASIEPIDEAVLNTSGTTMSLAERQVKEEYDRRMKMCGPEDLVAVIKSARSRTEKREATGRRVTAIDKKYLELAENLLHNELAFALEVVKEEIPTFIESRLG